VGIFVTRRHVEGYPQTVRTFLDSDSSRIDADLMTLFSNLVILDLLAKYKPIAAMTHTSALLGWDLEINMPEAGATARGQAQAEIELLRQKMTLDLTGLIEKAERQKTLNDAEKGVIRVIKRELDFYQKVPP